MNSCDCLLSTITITISSARASLFSQQTSLFIYNFHCQQSRRVCVCVCLCFDLHECSFQYVDWFANVFTTERETSSTTFDFHNDITQLTSSICQCCKLTSANVHFIVETRFIIKIMIQTLRGNFMGKSKLTSLIAFTIFQPHNNKLVNEKNLQQLFSQKS